MDEWSNEKEEEEKEIIDYFAISTYVNVWLLTDPQDIKHISTSFAGKKKIVADKSHLSHVVSFMQLES